MIYAVTVAVDLQTLDPALPLKLLAAETITPGTSRPIPGGIIVFQGAVISSEPGQPHLYRFVVRSARATPQVW